MPALRQINSLPLLDRITPILSMFEVVKHLSLQIWGLNVCEAFSVQNTKNLFSVFAWHIIYMLRFSPDAEK